MLGLHLQQCRKLIVIASHPIQYYAPLYRCMAARGATNLKVVYLSDAGAKGHQDPGFARRVEWDVPLMEGYEVCVLQPGSDITARNFWSSHSSELTSVLAREKPHWILLYGYSSRMNWVALQWAKKNGVEVAYSSDSNIRDPQRKIVRPFKRGVLRWFFSRVDAFFSPSEANVEYLLHYGASPDRISRIPFAIDVNRFSPADDVETDKTRPYDFVWAGKFQPFKRAADFIEALAMIANRNACRIRARVIGDGSCRPALEMQASQLPSNCTVDFTGFCNQKGMPAALQSAAVLVFTSSKEPYGLIATEAAAAGLALIVADNIGCVGSTVLAQPGVNALCYPCGDITALADAMERLMINTTQRGQMQKESMRIAKTHDISCAAEAIERALSAS